MFSFVTHLRLCVVISYYRRSRLASELLTTLVVSTLSPSRRCESADGASQFPLAGAWHCNSKPHTAVTSLVRDPLMPNPNAERGEVGSLPAVPVAYAARLRARL